MKIKGLISLFMVFIISCSDDDINEGFRLDSLDLDTAVIFGEIYGQCAGDCRTLYLLTEESIFEDANIESDFGNFQNIIFKNEPLSSDTFELSKALLDISEELLESNNEIGNQTIADFDYFVRISINDESRTWIFDEINENVSEEIKQYFERLIHTNNELKD